MAYIVDNSSDNQSVQKYLKEWCSVSSQMDIATGYLEIGGFLALDSDWQKLKKIRIILGNEMTKRTSDVISKAVDSYLSHFRDSIDKEQEQNEFLRGVPAIIDAIRTKKIELKVYDNRKFHAKAYITHFSEEYHDNFIPSMDIPKGYALVGSSNFTKAGLTQNVELNVQIKSEVEQLQSWFDDKWENATDITEAVLQVMERQCKEFSPYDVYLRSMYEYFKSREETISEWENQESVLYPVLSQYQKDGYNNLIEIANKYAGAFLCDGVGLGKTFVGMMLIERFVKKERKNVVLLVPASARVSVWEVSIKKYMPEILEGFFSFKIINHSDLTLEKNEQLMDQITEHSEIIIIDEAHHFRNRGSNRYRKLFDMMEAGSEKQMFMLTATPINNSFLDFQHLIELFTHRQDNYFSAAPLGIHSLSGHFKKMEAKLTAVEIENISNSVDASDNIFHTDPLVNELVVQRSRAYVKKSLLNDNSEQVVFSVRQAPSVVNYSLTDSYGKLIKDFTKSFDRKDKETGRPMPILSLAVYSPYEDEYYIGDRSKLDGMVTGRQAQVVNLIRQLLLKRFESSIAAFNETCVRIYVRLLKFLGDYKEYGNPNRIDRFIALQSDLMDYVDYVLIEQIQTSLEELEDDLPEYVWESQEEFSPSDFDIKAMLEDTMLDIEVLAEFIEDMKDFSPEKDDKISALKQLLHNDARIKNKKVIIFSEYRATAQYIYRELEKEGFHNLFEIDGRTKGNKHELIQRFAPYYNELTSSDIDDEIQILVATDVLAEGLNLQDASCLINYELHWNPVRLMQRIGRIDRRRNLEIEQKLLFDHPELSSDRDNAYYWNFLPPRELEQLLSLYSTVSRKTLRISKTFGIEGKQLLTPEDDYEALKDFNSQYEGTASAEEEMALAYQQLMMDNPDYFETVKLLPRKMHSGKTASITKGIFFCYELPTIKADGSWSNGDGIYRWYLVDNETNSISECTYEIWKSIECAPNERRYITIDETAFFDSKKVIETYINKNYLRKIVAPAGINARLITWMQLV